MVTIAAYTLQPLALTIVKGAGAYLHLTSTDGSFLLGHVLPLLGAVCVGHWECFDLNNVSTTFSRETHIFGDQTGFLQALETFHSKGLGPGIISAFILGDFFLWSL
jgi:hypothetical protein